MTFLYFLDAAIMGGVIYMAISQKSNFKIRVAALAALALMVVSVIICFVLYFKAASTEQYLILPDMSPSDMPPPQNKSPVTMIMTSIFLIVLFVGIFILALREEKRADGKEKPSGNGW